MKQVLFLFAFTATTIFTNCHMGTPVACSNVPTTGKTGTSITFTGCSTDAHHEEWNFGDAGTGTGASVTHAYNTAGTYSVKLTAYNSDKSKSDAVTKTIVISN
jgi:PKD repeat protein